jgi:flagellar biosynthesis chaperone FliJ
LTSERDRVERELARVAPRLERMEEQLRVVLRERDEANGRAAAATSELRRTRRDADQQLGQLQRRISDLERQLQVWATKSSRLAERPVGAEPSGRAVPRRLNRAQRRAQRRRDGDR